MLQLGNTSNWMLPTKKYSKLKNDNPEIGKIQPGNFADLML